YVAPRPMPALVASPVGAPTPVVPAAKPPVMTEAANWRMPRPTIVPVAHLAEEDEYGPAVRTVPPAPSASSAPNVAVPQRPAVATSPSQPVATMPAYAPAHQRPVAPMPAYAPAHQRGVAPTMPETAPEQRDAIDLAWPRVEHAEAPPAPWLRPSAEPKPVT